ncbi:MAG: hypothetical protein LQ338_001214 [Usnochroma carphineum]|nr:MAG: hypothetical protein LQ338_001214 [Usnochroma carphineum]
MGPESPNFIHIPRPPQPDAPYRPHIKGVLPIPRKIFPTTSKPLKYQKTSPSYLAATTPPPSPARLSAPKPTDPSTRRLVEWKAKLADYRRRNLRESLRELKTRKERSDRYLAARTSAAQSERAELLNAPAPPYERYTLPSILQSSLPQPGSVLPDPDRDRRIEQKRENHGRHVAMKQAERRNALHTLYMNARDFVVTEEKLSEAVERAFDPRSKQFDNEVRKGLNVWNLGYPETVKDMLEKANREGERGTAVQSMSGYGRVTGERMRRIGEELTGGKM